MADAGLQRHRATVLSMNTPTTTEPDVYRQPLPGWIRPLPLTGPVWVIVGYGAVAMGLLAMWFALLMPGNGWQPYLVCLGPVLVCAATTFADPADRRQYLVRPLAAAMFLSILAGFYATEADGVWDWKPIVGLVSWFIALAVGFLVLVLWQASASTRIDSGAGVGAAAAARRMADALRAVSGIERRLTVCRGTDDRDWTIDHSTDDDRVHRIELRIDEITGTLRVRELTTAAGAAPDSESEASMRGPGEPWFDPARPQAQRVWSKSWAATVIEPHRLPAVPAEMGSAIPTAAAWRAVVGRGDELMHLLAATALRAGLHWRPTLAQP